MKVWMYFLFVVFLAVRGTLSCNPDTGPAGDAYCFLGTPYYSRYQCSTCLSDAYIRQKSRGDHSCRDRTATYCHYQCMLEKYELDSGPVYEDCLCDPTRSLTSSVILPASCYSPAGADCDWYRNCLAKMFPCTGQAKYAIYYGEKFCNLYEQSSSKFSQTALQWMNAVRKCLQVALVPELHVCQVQLTCEDIKARAFNSHIPCYTEAYQGFSVCNVSVDDWLAIFATIKQSFESDFIETLRSSVITAGSCHGQFARDLGQYIYSVGVWLLGSASDSSSDDERAHAIILEISTTLRWDQDSTIAWYAFAINPNVIDYSLSAPSADQPGRTLIIQVKRYCYFLG